MQNIITIFLNIFNIIYITSKLQNFINILNTSGELEALAEEIISKTNLIVKYYNRLIYYLNKKQTINSKILELKSIIEDVDYNTIQNSKKLQGMLLLLNNYEKHIIKIDCNIQKVKIKMISNREILNIMGLALESKKLDLNIKQIFINNNEYLETIKKYKSIEDFAYKI